MTVIRSAYSERVRVKTPVIGESLTHQSFKEECDINNIVDKFARTGELPVTKREPEFIDVPEDTDFTTIQQRAAVGRTLWESLPEEYRETRYDNDIEAFLADPYPNDVVLGEDDPGPLEGQTGGSEVSNESPEPPEPIDPT